MDQQIKKEGHTALFLFQIIIYFFTALLLWPGIPRQRNLRMQ